MPAIPTLASILEHTLVHRALAVPHNVTAAASASTLEVVCAWPVSGQYGPGTRALYYVLIAACVVARKVEWIRNACLAAVLLFPAIAALHAIVLAALHVDGAVDMDVYGAFQLCAIGILTAPATVRLSRTYFNNPGRDIIFLWTVLLLVGLVCLVVEFMRLKTTTCPGNDPASISWAADGLFIYGSNCSVVCTPEDGPFSPLRLEAADNIYVIPVPDELSFNAITLVAAACCIPAILSLVSMWIKILDDNWEKFSRKQKQQPDEPIEGTNGATINHMTGIGERIKDMVSLIEIPVFAAAVLAILIKGEMNFWSQQMRYQTEPIQSIGQWAPIVGTGLAALGSLYLLFSAEMVAEEGKDDEQPGVNNVGQCACCSNCTSSETPTSSRRGSGTSAERQNAEIQLTPLRRHTTTQTASTNPPTPDLGRRKVARFFNKTSNMLATKAHRQIEKGGFKNDAKTSYPQTPGEEYKNSLLRRQEAEYKRSSTPDNRSRAGSSVSVRDSDNGEGSSRMSRSPTRHSVPTPTVSRPRSRPNHANSLPGRSLFESSTLHSPSPGSLSSGWPTHQLSPFDRMNSQRSRAPSLDESVSPTTSSPGIQIPPPTIVISSEDGRQ
ncbi:hypothetical protein N7457_002272 [Penicillium paradoxum]|uniref:uncharacterized protein n=1 Tax=Penicillium paradoxum TaxID=176176 RepID=UPI002548B599|nr:uncharacterized protein N7457_002272 [Penicillium paradoxum]KAJ5787282.1 hypothetical protein N7457_002272 [Penicillium paradoxum]